jgi:hypothetical protein
MEEQKIKLVLQSDMVAIANTVESAIELAKAVCIEKHLDSTRVTEIAKMIFDGAETIWKVRNSMPMLPMMQSPPSQNTPGEKGKKNNVVRMVVDNRDKKEGDNDDKDLT